VTIFLRARKNCERWWSTETASRRANLIHVTDAARVTVNLVEKGAEDLYNVGTGLRHRTRRSRR